MDYSSFPLAWVSPLRRKGGEGKGTTAPPQDPGCVWGFFGLEMGSAVVARFEIVSGERPPSPRFCSVGARTSNCFKRGALGSEVRSYLCSQGDADMQYEMGKISKLMEGNAFRFKGR